MSRGSFSRDNGIVGGGRELGFDGRGRGNGAAVL